MKQILSVIGIIILCLSLVGWGGDKGWQGQNKWSGPVYFWSTIVASGHKAGVTTNVSTESNLTSAALGYGMIRKTMDSPTNQNRTLANGVKGQMVTIQLIAKAAGNFVITKTGAAASAMTMTGWTSITFDTVLDSVTLLWLDDTYGWVIVGNAGTVIA